MNPHDRQTGHDLIDTAMLVYFEIGDTTVHEGPDPSEFGLDIPLTFPMDEDTEENDLHWGALGFIFAVAVQSFADARARGASEIEYQERDEFTPADLVSHLAWKGTTLQLSTDYLRGRRMKTDITLRADGTGRLRTQGRGMSATRWLNMIKGKKPLKLVQAVPA